MNDLAYGQVWKRRGGCLYMAVAQTGIRSWTLILLADPQNWNETKRFPLDIRHSEHINMKDLRKTGGWERLEAPQ
jgi:hypothetical protein